MSRFCSQCGCEIQPGSKFCSKCGKNIENVLEEHIDIQNSSTSIVQSKTIGNNNTLMFSLIVAILLIGGIGGYLFLARPSEDKNSVAQSQSKTVSVEKPQIVIEKSPVRDVIKEARQRYGYISPTKQYLTSSKYNIKNNSGNPVYFSWNPNYILLYEEPGKVEYLIVDSLECKKNASGIGVEINIDTATIENPNSAEPILIGIGGKRFSFNAETGLAGTNFDTVREFDYYEKEASLAYIPRSAAMAYYIATGKKWPKFRYGNDFYSLADR